MYLLSEEKMDQFLREADNISRKMVFQGTVPSLDQRHFGMAMVEVQTEIQNQASIRKIISQGNVRDPAN